MESNCNTKRLKTHTAVKAKAMADEIVRTYQANSSRLAAERAIEEIARIPDLSDEDLEEALSNLRERSEEEQDHVGNLISVLKGDGVQARSIKTVFNEWMTARCQDNLTKQEQLLQEIEGLTGCPKGASMADILRFVSGKTRMLRTRRASAAQESLLAQIVRHSAQGYSLEAAFEIDCEKAKQPNHGSGVLLFHCTRKDENIEPIVQEGLRLLGSGGSLGKGIYFSSIVSKCLSYSRDKEHGVIFGAEVFLGKVQVAKTSCFAAPPGYDSSYAPGSYGYAAAPDGIIHFSDGSTSAVYATAPSQHPKLSFHFANDEYAVYDESRVRLRFVLVFRRGHHPLLEQPKFSKAVDEELDAHFRFLTLLRAATAQRDVYEKTGNLEGAGRLRVITEELIDQCQLIKRCL